MHTPFSEIVARFMKLSALANEESRYSTNLIIGPGHDILPMDEHMATLMVEPTPCKAAMIAFLRNIPVSALHAMVALMYAGRHEVADPASYWPSLKLPFEDREAAVEAVAAKAVRNDYISAAIAQMPKRDIDMLPARIQQS